MLGFVPPRPRVDNGVDATRNRTDARPPGLETPVDRALRVLGSGPRLRIAWQLFWGSRSFSELLRASGLGRKSLRRELRALERSGSLRQEAPSRPRPRALYRLTRFGETARPFLAAFYHWGLHCVPRAAAGSRTASEPMTEGDYHT